MTIAVLTYPVDEHVEPAIAAPAVQPAPPVERLPIAVGLAFYAIFIARSGFTVGGRLWFSLFDDAMISMQYARNLAGGHGLVWNAGDAPVEGYTNFLWTLWLSILHLLPVPERLISLLVMLTGAALLVVTIVAAGAVADRLSPTGSPAPLVARWLVALAYPLIFWTLRGMEVGLLAALVTIGLVLALDAADDPSWRRLALLAAVGTAAILTRTDAVVAFAAIGAFVLARVPRERRVAVVTVVWGAAVATLAAHTAFRLAYYGVAVPNTYELKVGGVDLGVRLDRGGAALRHHAIHFLAPALLLAAAHVAIARRRTAPGVLALVGVFLSQSAYSAYVGGDAWEGFQFVNRFVAVGLPALLVVSALGIASLTASSRVTVRRTAAASAAGLVVFAALGMRTWAPMIWGLPRVSIETKVVRVLAYGLLAVAVVAAPLLARRARPVAVAMLTVLLLATLNWRAYDQWLGNNAIAEIDGYMAAQGDLLRQVTPEGTSIAVVWAGAIPYFAHRPAIDLMGKSDPVVAGSEWQRDYPWFPGHSKWDYEHSIGELRPDIIVQTWGLTPADREQLSGWGYRNVHDPHLWIHDRVDDVDVDRVLRFLGGGVPR